MKFFKSVFGKKKRENQEEIEEVKEKGVSEIKRCPLFRPLNKFSIKSLKETRQTNGMTFFVKSGKVHLTDPAYDRKTLEKISVTWNLTAKNGKWRAFLIKEENEGCVARLVAINTDYLNSQLGRNIRWQAIGPLFVDTAQAGIFDDALYPKEKRRPTREEFNDKQSFYGKVCDLTLSSNQGGIVDNLGVVSQSGYGDGMYATFGIEENGEYVAFCIDFLPDYRIKLECSKCGTENSDDVIFCDNCDAPLEFEEEL
ncbi:MAG: DUF4241 domain-containing protein [archaeon]|nr:DUF4241 domain-containing protein [archaeon]MCP8313716.1 DUF4241 domain-containing protein [archaeon]